MGESCSKLPSTLSQPVPARFSPTCFLVRRAEYTFHTRDILLGWLIEFSMSVARFSCVSLTRIGIRRALFEYSFENFTILDKKKNGKVQNRTLPFRIVLFSFLNSYNSPLPFAYKLVFATVKLVHSKSDFPQSNRYSLFILLVSAIVLDCSIRLRLLNIFFAYLILSVFAHSQS